MLKKKICDNFFQLIEISEEEKNELEKICKCWPYLNERTKGYMLGTAETNAMMMEQMRKKEEELLASNSI